MDEIVELRANFEKKYQKTQDAVKEFGKNAENHSSKSESIKEAVQKIKKAVRQNQKRLDILETEKRKANKTAMGLKQVAMVSNLLSKSIFPSKI